MPEPVRAGQRYMPGLDGLRALAVLAVIAFHEQLGWAPGGLLGVGVFFTLSGYLITDLLLGQWAATGRLALADFWARRARRLLPALFVMLAVVTAWVTIADRARLAGLRGAVAAAATYSSNWYLIIQGQSYFARFAPPAPLDHLWSLAVEEQFYLAWPWMLLAGLFLVRKLRRGRPGGVAWLALPTLALAAASSLAMLALYHPGLDPTRIYEGTDTRAAGLLIGAALAMTWPSRRAASRHAASTASHATASHATASHATASRHAAPIASHAASTASHATAGQSALGSAEAGRHAATSPGTVAGRHAGPPRAASAGRATRIAVDAAAFAGLAVILIMIWRTGQYSAFLYRGGLVVLSLASAAVIAAAATPGSLTGKVLGCGPMRWLGVRSYGIYLWHYPVIVLTTPANATENLARAAWQTAVTIVVSALSWRYIEQPVRRGALGRIWTRVRAGQLGRTARPATLAAITGAVAVLATACAGLTGAVHAPSPGASNPNSLAVGSTLPAPPAGASAARPAGTGKKLSPSSSPGAGTSPAHPAAVSNLRTSCREVVHIGDSTSEGMVSPSYLPSPAQRLTAQYQDVGVQTIRTNIVGANSVVETLPGDTNGYNAARDIDAGGYHGCWVLALGTNDTADVAIGSDVSRLGRIQEMMSAAHGQPVLWVNVVSILNSGPYSEANMQQWNAALQQACSRYKNMRIFNWASLVQPSWFVSDGIHYTPGAYAVRAQQIAQALAKAFPAKGHSNGCTVS
jgi:peptidoglycan/LPS O-acetylase OafA/YrhL